MAQNRKLTTVQAALRVLTYLSSHPEGLEAAQVATLLGKSLSTAYALLASLVAEGFAEREGNAYRLSQSALAPVAQTPNAEPEKLQHGLDELYLRTRERSYLALLHGNKLKLVSRGRQGLPKPPGLEGDLSRGLHALALGKAVLAFLPEELQALHLNDLERHTALTLTDPLALQEELEKVRQMSFAVEMEEYAEGASGLAAPIFGTEGQVLGSFGVVVPSRRFPYAFTRLLQAVQEVARAASRHVHSEPHPDHDPAGFLSRTNAVQMPLLESKVYAPARLREEANLQDYFTVHQQSLQDPAGFWAQWAERFEWFKPWDQVAEIQPPNHRWFVGGQTNIAHNALDRHAAASKRNQLALVALSGDGTIHKLTYRELRDRSSQLAAALKRRGVSQGDRVAVYLPSSLETALSFLACARIGAIHVAIPAGLSAVALRERLKDTQTRLLITTDRIYQAGRSLNLSNTIAEATEGLDLQIIWHQRGDTSAELSFWPLLEAERPGLPAVALDSEHPLFILYTSGSTGKPKGVVHVHGGYMVGTTYALRMLYDLKDGETLWTTADLSWIVGHGYGLYAPLLEGLTTIVREERFDHPHPNSFYEILEGFGVNMLLTSPTLLRTLRRHGESWAQQANLSDLRLVGSVGEYLAPEVWHWVHQHLGFVLDNWWQTETGAPCVGTPVSLAAKPGKAGFALPGVEAEIVDHEGNLLPDGQRGHLLLKQVFPHFMRTYWNNPAGFAEQWQRIPGGYATGDLAVRDSEGYIALLGRGDDVIKTGEQRIGTAEIEGSMLTHPAVAEAAAIGIADPELGEVIKVFVVLKSKEASPEVRQVLSSKLVTHLRREIAALTAPIEVECLDKLPRTKSGKILRRLLRATAVGADPGDLSTLEE